MSATSQNFEFSRQILPDSLCNISNIKNNICTNKTPFIYRNNILNNNNNYMPNQRINTYKDSYFNIFYS
jgi:hypothetical protein